MWTIKEAADRAGLNPDVLRAWERRYGVVQPTRTSSGYRLYSQADIERLRAMQQLIDEGFRPREAADHLDRNAAAVAEALRRRDQRSRASAPGPGTAETVPGSRSPAGADARVSRLVAAATRLDVAGLSAYFDSLGALGMYETACEKHLFPALRALGDAWKAGKVSVAGEHAASAAALRWLGAQYRAAARDSRRPQVLVVLPPGAHHELGALAHAVALRRSGLDVLYLGPDLPVEDLAEAVRMTGARAVVIGVVMESDGPAARRMAAAIAAASPEVRLAFGGPAASALAAHGAVLPEGLGAAAGAVRALLDGKARAAR